MNLRPADLLECVRQMSVEDRVEMDRLLRVAVHLSGKPTVGYIHHVSGRVIKTGPNTCIIEEDK